MYYALVDCNNFYASCELVFSPKLANKPLAILSNNDGCIIARSKEAKKMGIPMGTPIFEQKELIKSGHLSVLSSNFPLYGDMSSRVMNTLKTFELDMEIYSIDEAFLAIPFNDEKSICQLGVEIRNKVLQWTGIPTSVGIAKTKTLAKLANNIAKKDPKMNGVFFLSTPSKINTILAKTPVETLWGVGSRQKSRLARQQIFYASQLKDAEDAFIKKHFHLPILRTAYELRGTPCITHETQVATKKSITCSRSFTQRLTQLDDIHAAIANFATIAGEKLRKNKLQAHYLSVFLSTSRSVNYSFEIAHLTFPHPTAFTPSLISYAKNIATSLFQKDIPYKKAGVILSELTSEKQAPPDIFTPQELLDKQDRIMNTVDSINKTRKSKSIYFASTKHSTKWEHASQNKTPCFTTQWKELPTAR